jgi:hypothetical protein
MLSDVDEIPAPSAVDAIRATRRAGPFVFEQRFHSTALEWLHPIQPWLGTVAGRLGDLDPTGWRNGRGDFHSAGQIVRMGGWHFSWLGTDDERARKLDTFSHAELRGQFDPADGRRGGYHANGERLVEIADVDMDRIDWPVPIIDGTFEVPADWFRNASAFR